jgi:hypothetical protein
MSVFAGDGTVVEAGDAWSRLLRCAPVERRDERAAASGGTSCVVRRKKKAKEREERSVRPCMQTVRP